DGVRTPGAVTAALESRDDFVGSCLVTDRQRLGGSVNIQSAGEGAGGQPLVDAARQADVLDGDKDYHHAKQADCVEANLAQLFWRGAEPAPGFFRLRRFEWGRLPAHAIISGFRYRLVVQ